MQETAIYGGAGTRPMLKVIEPMQVLHFRFTDIKHAPVECSVYGVEVTHTAGMAHRLKEALEQLKVKSESIVGIQWTDLGGGLWNCVVTTGGARLI